MNQATLDLTRPVTADTLDRTGFEIGWDHAHHGLVPPPELLTQGTPLAQGWLAGKAVFGRRTLTSSRAVRCWLALRIEAWRTGVTFELQQVTPNYIAQLQTERCPVLRTPLGGAAGQPDAAVITRINPDAGYAAGNLVQLSQAAVAAREGVDLLQTIRHARRAQIEGEAVEGLHAAAWWRLATLRSLATPLRFHEAAALPLALMPPNRVRVLNAAQGLQTLLTLQFATPGWSARTRAIGELLPEHTLRQDYNLFVGAVAPRLLEAGGGTVSRQKLEDLWLNERVQRRWQHFLLSLGEAGTAALVERAAALGLAGTRVLQHDDAQAVDGWGLKAAPARSSSRRGNGPQRLAGTAGKPPKNSASTSGASVV